jgi:hypothetical protein
MPSQPSSLSTAIQAFANYLAGELGDIATVMVDTPQKANDQAKGSLTDILNVFIYRIAPSGIHADFTQNDPTFVRANILLTPFPRATGDSGETDLDLRVLGHALAILQSAPVIPITLPAAPGSPEANALHPQTTFYQLQAVLQAPPMEEMNHIWTTQGGELGYRLSAAYELALIPIEPLTYVPAPTDVRAAFVGVSPDITNDAPTSPIAITAPNAAQSWMPSLMLASGGTLTNSGTAAPGATTIDIAISGLPSADAEIIVDWTRADASTDTQTAQTTTIASPSLDDPAAQIAITLRDATDGDTARISARPQGAGTEAAGNVVELKIIAGGT